MNLHIRKLHALFCGEVSGMDLRQPLDHATRSAIVRAADEYAVLVFRNQSMDQDAQVRLGMSFGPLTAGIRRVNRRPNRFKHDELIDISNVEATGEVAKSGNRLYASLANQLWHSDSSFENPPARYSLLLSVVNPPKGGDTEFADMRAAWDRLDHDMKARTERLEAEHFALYSRINLGYTDYTDEDKRAVPPVRWPLVKTHRGSGRKLLFIGAHATHVVGMHVGEGRMLLADLLEHATQRELVYRHHWQVGDLVMWDNRSTLHRGRPYDMTQRRELRRTTTIDLDVPAQVEPASAQ